MSTSPLMQCISLNDTSSVRFHNNANAIATKVAKAAKAAKVAKPAKTEIPALREPEFPSSGIGFVLLISQL